MIKMPPIRRECIRVDYICDECKEGILLFNGCEIDGFLPWFEHTCNKCYKVFAKRMKYPYTKEGSIFHLQQSQDD